MGWERMALYPGERCLNGCYQIPLFGESAARRGKLLYADGAA